MMVVGVLQFELIIHDAASLKDKRRVVRSVKDRLHREHQVSVAEVGSHEILNVAVMGLAAVASDGKRAGEILDRISVKLRATPDAELGDTRRDFFRGEQGEIGPPDGGRELDEAALAAEMLKDADSITRETR